MRAAALQLESQDDVAANLAVIAPLLRAAREDGAELVVLPEGFAFLGAEVDKAAHAEELGAGGPIQDFLRNQAVTHDFTIIAGGLPEKSADAARPYNTSLVVTPEGELAERYRKIHLFDVDLKDGTKLTESAGNSAGDEVRVVRVGDFGVGLSICYDLRFPELFRRERDGGAHVLTLPAAFTKTTGSAHWHVLLRARAIETQCYVIAAAQWGQHPRGRETFGDSLVIDPWGEVLAEKTEGVGFITADLSLERVLSVREQMPLERHRRL